MTTNGAPRLTLAECRVAYRTALYTPDAPIEGWRQGYIANADYRDAEIMAVAQCIQQRWRDHAERGA